MKPDYTVNSGLFSNSSSDFSSILLTTSTFADGYQKGQESIYFGFVFNFLETLVKFKDEQKTKNLGNELKELMKFLKVPSLFKQSLHFNPVHVNL